MDRTFRVTCPTCHRSYSVDYEIRFVDVQLECPYCRAKFKVDEAHSIDERWGWS